MPLILIVVPSELRKHSLGSYLGNCGALTWQLLASLEVTAGAEGKADLLMSVTNWGEVYYSVRHVSPPVA